MKNKYSSAFIATVTASFLIGCSKTPPTCSDEETFAVVKKIVLDQLGGTDGISEKEVADNLRIELPRASAFDEKIKKYSCEAKLVAGNKYELPISYESQLNDKGQHIVTVDGIGRGDLFAMMSGMIDGIRKGRAETDGAVAKPTDAKLSTIQSEQKISEVDRVTESVQNQSRSKSGPSFDCAKASTYAENEICNDPRLGKLDVALSENYKYMLASDIGDGARTDLKETQKKWIADRSQCTDKKCLVEAYQKRIDAVCDYPVVSGMHPICTTAGEIK